MIELLDRFQARLCRRTYALSSYQPILPNALQSAEACTAAAASRVRVHLQTEREFSGKMSLRSSGQSGGTSAEH